MQAKEILLLSSLVLAAFPALAFHCQQDMQKIDAKLASNPPITPQQLQEVQALRAQGEAYHRAGDHSQSVEVLGRAMRILQIR